MNLFRYSSKLLGPLASNAAHQFAQSHALCLYKANAIYSFIPKNACSTLRYSLAIYNGCLESGGNINWIHDNNKTFVAGLPDAIKADYKFVVLRCPLRRLASVFLDKFVGKEGPSWAFYDMIGRSKPLDEVTFRYFVESLSKDRLLAREIHWRPQIDFLLYREYSDVFSVEKFSEAVNRLNQKLGFRVHDARSLTKHGSDNYKIIQEGCWAEVPVKELYQLKMSGLLPAPSSLFNQKLYKLARSMYADDVDIYKKFCDESDLLSPIS